jgi:hypothetical protein
MEIEEEIKLNQTMEELESSVEIDSNKTQQKNNKNTNKITANQILSDGRTALSEQAVIAKVSYTSFLKQSTSEPIRQTFDDVIFKDDEAWERS